MTGSSRSSADAPATQPPAAAQPPLSKIEQAKAELCGLELAPRLEELGHQGWEALDEATLTIRLKWLGIFFRPVTPGRFMVRLRLPNGVIRSEQLEVLAEAVDRCGEHGSADITTRQNLQLRGLLLEDMAPLMAALERVGLTSRQSGHDNPRNITGNPLAGIDPEEFLDTRPLVEAIQAALLGPEGPRNLPRKFNVAVGGAPDSFLLHNDLAFLPARRGGELGFTVMVGGFFSAQRNELAVPLGLWLPAAQLPAFTLAVLRHYGIHGNRQQRNKSRLMYLVDQLGLEAYRQAVLASWAELAADLGPDQGGDPATAAAHDGSHLVTRAPRDGLGVQAQKQAGLHWVGLHVPMGRFDAETMTELARLARTYGSGELRLTEAQNALLVNVPADRVELRPDPHQGHGPGGARGAGAARGAAPRRAHALDRLPQRLRPALHGPDRPDGGQGPQGRPDGGGRQDLPGRVDGRRAQAGRAAPQGRAPQRSGGCAGRAAGGAVRRPPPCAGGLPVTAAG